MTTLVNTLISLTIVFLVLFVTMIIALVFNLFSFVYVIEPITEIILKNQSNPSNTSNISYTFSNHTTISNDISFTAKDKASTIIMIVLILIGVVLFWLINTLMRVMAAKSGEV